MYFLSKYVCVFNVKMGVQSTQQINTHPVNAQRNGRMWETKMGDYTKLEIIQKIVIVLENCQPLEKPNISTKMHWKRAENDKYYK